MLEDDAFPVRFATTEEMLEESRRDTHTSSSREIVKTMAITVAGWGSRALVGHGTDLRGWCQNERTALDKSLERKELQGSTKGRSSKGWPLLTEEVNEEESDA